MMNRKRLEEREHNMLSNFGCKSAESRGRLRDEESCPMRTEFQRDRDRIIHSKAFRRLMHKTQVFLSPEGDHFRTRLTHTLEVSQIARTIARGLMLNEDLTEAIALGHDLGHTPFGHNGEMILNAVYPGGFKHNVQSLRIVDILENFHDGRGMNLTHEVRDGILNHTGAGIPFTLEGQIVKTADRIAYINHDIDDALRSQVIYEDELPKEAIEYLGRSHRNRINTLVVDMIENSLSQDIISMSEEATTHMNQLRAFMFKKVYHNQKVKKASDLERVEHGIKLLYRYYCENPDLIPKELIRLMDDENREEIVKDYIAGMTDRYALNKFVEIKKVFDI